MRDSDSIPSTLTPSVLEFFAGGGLALKGLEGRYRCVFANDIDPLKSRVYRDNFPGAHFHEGDVWKLSPASIPDADLAWASFPCQDLSLAGGRKGLNAPRSGAFWGFWRLMEAMEREDRAPRTLALENVTGLISSRRGRDFCTLVETLANAGYRVGAMVMDAVQFTPQSRPRLFIIAHKGKYPAGLEGAPDPIYHPSALQAAVAKLEPTARLAWTWWKLPVPPARNTHLTDILDTCPDDALWRSSEAAQKIINQMAPLHRARFDQALDAGDLRVGAVYRRIRVENGQKIQRAEIRYDGLAGCLRTPAGGSSKQLLMITYNGKARLRPLSAREAARLMGLDDAYRLPSRETPALKVLGDGVCTPVVRWLADNLLTSLSSAGAAPARSIAAE